MDFTREDLIKYCGKQRGSSTFIALRRANLGYWKMVTRGKYDKRFGKHTNTSSTVHFAPDEVISFFTSRIKKAKKNAYMSPNPMWIMNWEAMIKLAKHFKDIK